MTDEKVLAFLNLSKDKREDKFLPKISIWFDIGYTVMINAVLLFISFSQFHIVIAISFVFVDLLFFLWLSLYKNPVQQFFLSFVVLLVSTLKLFYGYVEVSIDQHRNDGIPIFTWIHFAVLIAAICLAVYALKKWHRIYRSLKQNDIKSAQKKIRKENSFPTWVMILAGLAGSPIVFVRACKNDLKNFGLGGGFALWLMGCCWMVILLSLLPKCVVAIRSDVSKLFQKQI